MLQVLQILTTRGAVEEERYRCGSAEEKLLFTACAREQLLSANHRNIVHFALPLL